MEEEYNVKKSKSWKLCKSLLQRKKNCSKNHEKTICFLLRKSDEIDSYSYQDETDAVKVHSEVISDSSNTGIWFLFGI